MLRMNLVARQIYIKKKKKCWSVDDNEWFDENTFRTVKNRKNINFWKDKQLVDIIYKDFKKL